MGTSDLTTASEVAFDLESAARPSVPVPPFAVAIIRRRRVARFERLKTSECKSADLAADVASAAESSGTGAATASGREGGRERLRRPYDHGWASGEREREVGSFKNVNSTSYERENKTHSLLNANVKVVGSSDVFSWDLLAFSASSSQRPPRREKGGRALPKRSFFPSLG